jgi:hypothetical protein
VDALNSFIQNSRGEIENIDQNVQRDDISGQEAARGY